MYEQYWGCDRNPFACDASPELFYPTSSARAALLKLHYLVEQRLGAGLLAGASGTGKSCLVGRLLAELPEEHRPHVQVLFPAMTAREMLAHLARQLADGVQTAICDDGKPVPCSPPPGAGGDEHRLDLILWRIEASLRRHAEAGRNPLIIIDEAHLIDDPQVFQALRLLLNFREQQGLNFALLLVGEPILVGQAARMAQLGERLAVKCILRPMTREESNEYIAHRLEAAGRRAPVFDEGALQALFELSGGFPRRLNRLCDLAMLVGCADGREMITAGEVEAVGAELLAGIPG